MTSTTFTRTGLIARLKQERGQAMVEFAMVLPVLMLIIVGILTFGRYMNYASQETQLASEAARAAAVDVNPSSTLTLQNYVQSQATGELGAGSSSVTSKAQVYIYYPTGSSNTVGQPVRACVIATVNLLPLALGSLTSAQIVETATMRIEQAQTSAQWTPSTSVPAQCPTS